MRWTGGASAAVGRLLTTTSVSKKIKQIFFSRKKIICVRKKINSFAKIEKEIPRKYFFRNLNLTEINRPLKKKTFMLLNF